MYSAPTHQSRTQLLITFYNVCPQMHTKKYLFRTSSFNGRRITEGREWQTWKKNMK